MLNFNQDTRKAIAIIRAGAEASGKDYLGAIKRLGSAWKPDDLDSQSRKMLDYYDGRQDRYLKKALQAQFEATWHLIPRVVLNFSRLYAETAAAVFDYPPTFWLEGDGTQATATEAEEMDVGADTLRLPPDDERATLYADEIEASAFVSTFADAERKAQLPGSMLVRVGWDHLGEHCRFSVFWPHDVLIAVHHSCPESLEYAYLIATRISSEAGVAAGGDEDSELWEVWARGYREDENGIPIFEPWEMLHVPGKGQVRVMSPENPADRLGAGLVQPYVLLRTGHPSGTPWAPPQVDVPSIQDAINVSQCNEQYIGNMQAHDEKVYSGNDTQKKVGGPGKILQVGPGETITAMSYNPKLDALQRGRAQLVQHFGRTKRQSPDAYTAENGNVLSGVSRMIANEPQEKARLEAVAIAKGAVQSALEKMIIVHDHHAIGRDLPLYGEGVRPKWKPTPPPDYEEAEAKQRRIHADLDKGLISKARAVVELGYYENEADAVKAGHSDQIGKSQTEQMATPNAPTLRQRLLGRTPPPPAPEGLTDGQG